MNRSIKITLSFAEKWKTNFIWFSNEVRSEGKKIHNKYENVLKTQMDFLFFCCCFFIWDSVKFKDIPIYHFSNCSNLEIESQRRKDRTVMFFLLYIIVENGKYVWKTSLIIRHEMVQKTKSFEKQINTQF